MHVVVRTIANRINTHTAVTHGTDGGTGNCRRCRFYASLKLGGFCEEKSTPLSSAACSFNAEHRSHSRYNITFKISLSRCRIQDITESKKRQPFVSKISHSRVQKKRQPFVSKLRKGDRFQHTMLPLSQRATHPLLPDCSPARSHYHFTVFFSCKYCCCMVPFTSCLFELVAAAAAAAADCCGLARTSCCCVDMKSFVASTLLLASALTTSVADTPRGRARPCQAENTEAVDPNWRLCTHVG